MRSSFGDYFLQWMVYTKLHSGLTESFITWCSNDNLKLNLGLWWTTAVCLKVFKFIDRNRKQSQASNVFTCAWSIKQIEPWTLHQRRSIQSAVSRWTPKMSVTDLVAECEMWSQQSPLLLSCAVEQWPEKCFCTTLWRHSQVDVWPFWNKYHHFIKLAH